MLSIPLRSALTAVTKSVTERLPGSSSLPKTSWLIGFLGDLGDVAGVIGHRPFGARVEAALHPEHDQDHHDQGAAQGEAPAEHDLLALRTAFRPRASRRPS